QQVFGVILRRCCCIEIPVLTALHGLASFFPDVETCSRNIHCALRSGPVYRLLDRVFPMEMEVSRGSRCRFASRIAANGARLLCPGGNGAVKSDWPVVCGIGGERIAV